jgi:hypothetical protein
MFWGRKNVFTQSRSKAVLTAPENDFRSSPNNRQHAPISTSSQNMHGGMGMTNELEVGKLFKRATVLERIYGCTEGHLLRYSAAQHKSICDQM